MTNTKITERDIYTAILNGTVDTDVLKAFAEKKLAQLEKRNESAKIRAAKKFITDEAQTRAQITAAMVAEGFDVTEGKVGARLNKLVANGQIAKAKGRVAGEDGKSKSVTLYATEFVEE